MANATNDNPDILRLAGDLAGNNDATAPEAPELTATAVTPGSYDIALLTIDGKGRVTTASSASGSDLADAIQVLLAF